MKNVIVGNDIRWNVEQTVGSILDYGKNLRFYCLYVGESMQVLTEE